MGTSTPIFPQVINTPVLMYSDSNVTQVVPFWQASANGDKIEDIAMCSTDTNATVFNLFLQNAGINYPIGTVAVPAQAGTDAAVTAAVNVLSQTGMMPWIRTDSNGRPYMYIAPPNSLCFQVQTAGLTKNKKISIMGQIGSY